MQRIFTLIWDRWHVVFVVCENMRKSVLLVSLTGRSSFNVLQFIVKRRAQCRFFDQDIDSIPYAGYNMYNQDASSYGK